MTDLTTQILLFDCFQLYLGEILRGQITGSELLLRIIKSENQVCGQCEHTTEKRLWKMRILICSKNACEEENEMKKVYSGFTIFLMLLSFPAIAQVNIAKNEEKIVESETMSRDEWEWALRAVMAYKTLYQYGYYPTYDEYVLKYANKQGLMGMYQAECLSSLETRKLLDKANTISLFVGLYLQKDGQCDAFTMAKIVKTLVEE